MVSIFAYYDIFSKVLCQTPQKRYSSSSVFLGVTVIDVCDGSITGDQPSQTDRPVGSG